MSAEKPDADDSRATKRSFALSFVAALLIGLAAAALLSPVIAMAVAAFGFRFPFPRIFDRTVMITLAAGLIWFARPLELVDLLRTGFDSPKRNLRGLMVGLVLSIVSVAVLLGVARIASGAFPAPSTYLGRALKYLPAALLIALLEEAFFRAFLLAGIQHEFGTAAALVASSAFYAVVHVVRSPRHFYLSGFHAMAGFHNLAASADRLAHPAIAAPTLTGLFLLGVLLGEAFLLTRRAYCSLGLHAGFVLGAKTWRLAASHAIGVPWWLAGQGPVPLIAAPAGWAVAFALMILLPLCVTRPQRSSAHSS